MSNQYLQSYVCKYLKYVVKYKCGKCSRTNRRKRRK